MIPDLRHVVEGFAGELTIQRRRAGTYTLGAYVEATPSRHSVRAVVQPVGRDAKLLPEGVRAEDAVSVWTTCPTRTAADPTLAQGDRFHFDNDVFEIVRVDEWFNLGLFFRAVAVRRRDAGAQ